MNTLREFRQGLPPQAPPSRPGETFCDDTHAPSWTYVISNHDGSGRSMHGCMRAHNKGDLVRMLKIRYPAQNIVVDQIQKVTGGPRTRRSRLAA
jgi:hypothetical protein